MSWTYIAWLAQVIPPGAALTFVWRRLRKPKIVITGRRNDAKARFTVHYLGDFPLTERLTLVARVQGDEATLEGEPLLLAGPNHSRQVDGEVAADPKQWRASFDGLRPLSTWGLEVNTRGVPSKIELDVHYRQYFWTFVAPRGVEHSQEHRGGILWLFGGAALAWFIYAMSLYANTGIWTGDKNIPADVEPLELALCALAFIVFAAIPYYFCLRIWQNEVAPAALTQGYLGWERPRRPSSNDAGQDKPSPSGRPSKHDQHAPRRPSDVPSCA